MPLRICLLTTLLLTSACCPLSASDSPAHALMRYRQALLEDDFSVLIKNFDEERLLQVRKHWQTARNSLSGEHFDVWMSLLLDAGASQRLGELSQALVNRQQITRTAASLERFALVLQQQCTDQQTLDQTDRQLLKSLAALSQAAAAWLKQADLQSNDKRQQAITLISTCCRKLDIADSAALEKLSLEDCLQRLGIISANLKQIAALYDIDIQALLTSTSITGDVLDDAHHKLNIGFKAFGQQQQFSMLLKRELGSWRCDWPLPALALPSYADQSP